MTLPTPSWLTLVEALAWLAERSVPDADAKAALRRAFRNGDIQTRGRSKEYYKHDTQTRIRRITWDKGDVRWDQDSFTVPSRTRRGENILISDVEISTDDLSEWFSRIEVIADTPKTKDKRPIFKTDVEAEYTSRVDEVRKETGRAPAIEADLEWGRSKGIDRETVRQLRRETLTEEEKKGGRPTDA